MNFAVYLFPLHFWYGCSRCRMLLSISCKIFYFSRLSPVHYWFTFPWHRDWKQVKCWIIRVMKEKIRTFHQIYFSLWMENHARTKDVGNSLYHVMFIQLFLYLASSDEVFVPSLRWYLYPLQSVRTLDLMFLSGTCLNQGKSARAGNKGVKTWIINIISRYPKTNNWPWIYKHQGQFMICQ